jgi:hypothetical protein
MKAGTWGGLGVVFLVLTCVFPVAIFGALVCFVGMIVAMYAPKQTSQVAPPPHTRFAGEFQVNATAPPSIVRRMQVGSPVAVKHVRRSVGEFSHTDKMVLFYGKAEIGDVPEPMQTRYMQAYKHDMKATFEGRVSMIYDADSKPVVVVACDRTDVGKFATAG